MSRCGLAQRKGTRCSLTLTDAATGRTPDTFRVEPVRDGWTPAD